MFRVRAYLSRAAGESGRVTPDYSSSSGSFATAKHVARQLANEFGAAVVENDATGNRTWFAKGEDK